MCENFRRTRRKLFNEPINRSMIHPIDIEYDGQARACHVHDIILDLIVSKADDEIFARLINRKDAVVSDLKVRRILLDYCSQEFSTKSLVVSQARSLSVFGHYEQLFPLWKFNTLRVVDIKGPIKVSRKTISRILESCLSWDICGFCKHQYKASRKDWATTIFGDIGSETKCYKRIPSNYDWNI